jgi:hypothetical protein
MPSNVRIVHTKTSYDLIPMLENFIVRWVEGGEEKQRYFFTKGSALLYKKILEDEAGQ